MSIELPALELASSPRPMVPDDYVTRVVKYIPAEVVAVYIAIDGILRTATLPASFWWAVFSALLLLTALYTWRSTQMKELPPAYLQIAVSTASFAVWVFALGGPFYSLSWYNPAYGSVLIMLFTLVPPLVVGK
jgi:hypothetical protein